MITAIVLSAGESRRMGTSKALLRLGEKTFVRHILDLYASSDVDHIVVVTAPQATEIERELAGSRATIVVNRDYRDGQLTSIVAGIDTAQALNSDAVLVHPVDHPLVSTKLINSLVAAYHPPEHLVVIPVFEGKRGHPALFSSRLFDELRNAPRDVGARAVIRANKQYVVEVSTDDHGTVADIDTPEDYEHLQRNL